MESEKQEAPAHLRHLTRLRQCDVAYLHGVTQQAVARWVHNGCPRNEEGSLNIRDVLAWRTARLEARPGRAARSAPSPALERMRLAKARMAELDLELKRGLVIPLERVNVLFTRMANIVRQTGDALQRTCGSEAKGILDEALLRLQREIEAECNIGAEEFQSGLGDE